MQKDPESYLTEAMGHLDDGEPTKADAILVRFMNEVPKEERGPKLMIEYHILTARLLTRRSKHLKAVQQCMVALRLAEQIKDPGAQAGALRWLGHIHWRKGEFPLAVEYLEKGLAKARGAGVPSVEGSILVEMGNCHCLLAEVNLARKEYRKAIEIFEKSGETKDLGRALNNLGDSYLQEKKFPKAIELLKMGKQAAGKNINILAWASMNLAECYYKTGRMGEAMREVDVSLPLMKRSGDRFGTAMAYEMKGVLLWNTGDWDGGEANLTTARDITHEIEMPVNEAGVMRDLGFMYMMKGDLAAARRMLEGAKAVYVKHKSAARLVDIEKDLRELEKRE